MRHTQASLNLGGRELEVVCLGLSQPFRHNSLLKCVSQREIVVTKTPVLGVQSDSMPLMLTCLRSFSPVLVTISSMSVPICNHFYFKTTNFSGAPPSAPHSRGSPSPSGIKFCHEILETLGYHMVKSLSYVGSSQY